MRQDYRLLTLDEHEAIEKQTLRTIVQALQDYSREAREIFENTQAASDTEVIVIAEDLVQYALEVAECYPINRRFAGFIDYKRLRWLSTPYGIFPQALLVDAKASTENNRETLQTSQLPMDAEFECKDKVVLVNAGVPPHQAIRGQAGHLHAVTTSAFVHFYYKNRNSVTPPFRSLRAIYVILLPHQRLKERYNPNAQMTFFGQGKHSPARQEAQRIRVYFTRLREICPWRLQELRYANDETPYTTPSWRDQVINSDSTIKETNTLFDFIGR